MDLRRKETSERILEAAKAVFQEKGYDAATTREIAQRAGSNIGLIKRYYGSKLALFKAAITPNFGLGFALRVPPNEMLDLLTNYYTDGAPRTGFDPFLTLVRSIASPEAGPMLIELLTRNSLEPLTERIGGGPEARARATLVASQLAGLILQYRIMGLTPENTEERETVRVLLRRHLDQMINGK